MNTKLEHKLALLAAIGFILLLGCFFIASEVLRSFMVVIGFGLIGAGTGSSMLCFHAFGTPLSFDHLACKKIRFTKSHDWTHISVGTRNSRILSVSEKLGKTLALLHQDGADLEITSYKKECFADLDSDKFFLEGNTIVRIIPAEELAAEKSTSKQCAKRDHSWNA